MLSATAAAPALLATTTTVAPALLTTASAIVGSRSTLAFSETKAALLMEVSAEASESILVFWTTHLQATDDLFEGACLNTDGPGILPGWRGQAVTRQLVGCPHHLHGLQGLVQL